MDEDGPEHTERPPSPDAENTGHAGDEQAMRRVDPMWVFSEAVRSLLDPLDVPYDLEYDEAVPRWTLRIPRRSEQGFDVGVTCETYGLYPWAGGWHGTPWEFGPRRTVQETCAACLGLVRRLLTAEARLRILEHGGRPSRWIMELREEGEWRLYEETGVLIYSCVDTRNERIMSNGAT
jgi:hypothetical protein